MAASVSVQSWFADTEILSKDKAIRMLYKNLYYPSAQTICWKQKPRQND